MKYDKIKTGKFEERPNRFVAWVWIDGKKEKVHVKNTGRCGELLLPGTRVYLEDFSGNMRDRKLRYSLVAVEKRIGGKNKKLINMDSQAPNKVVKEALEEQRIRLEGMGRLTYIKPEFKYGSSRIDFYVEDEDENKALIEVKGVTLEHDGIVRFPDAPTERGRRHIEELIRSAEDGYKAYILFIVQMANVLEFQPNKSTDPEFSDALKKSIECGVNVLVYDCKVDTDGMRINREIKALV